jgi:DNA-binding response OmpR family regulator
MQGVDSSKSAAAPPADDRAQCSGHFLNAIGSTQERVQGASLGAVDFISKPFQTAGTLARVRTHGTGKLRAN